MGTKERTATDKGGSEELNDGNQKITPKHVLRKNNTYSLG